MFTTINEIVQLSRENGYTFFDKDRQLEHKTRVLPTLYGGIYFITEQLHNGKKFYSKNEFFLLISVASIQVRLLIESGY